MNDERVKLIKSIKQDVRTAMRIVRGRIQTSSFDPNKDQTLTMEHCSNKVWETIENIHRMARRTEDGGGRDAAVKRFGRTWWDDFVTFRKETEPAIFGSLYVPAYSPPSPAYSPSSPAYSPTSPAYSPSGAGQALDSRMPPLDLPPSKGGSKKRKMSADRREAIENVRLGQRDLKIKHGRWKKAKDAAAIESVKFKQGVKELKEQLNAFKREGGLRLKTLRAEKDRLHLIWKDARKSIAKRKEYLAQVMRKECANKRQKSDDGVKYAGQRTLKQRLDEGAEYAIDLCSSDSE